MNKPEELSALAFISDRFAGIKESFDEIDGILKTRLDRFVDLLEVFQRGYMEVENIQDEISHQLRNTRDFISEEE